MTAIAAPDVATPVERDLTKLYLGFAGMVVGQFMAILDIQIIAASIAQIQAGIGATADEIAWIQTIYLLTEVMIMPLSAYMSRLWGTQKMFMTCCAAFMVTSVWAGLSTSIDMMIVARALQGLAAGAMIPAVFATAFTAFPPERRIGASVIIGMIVTLAPTIGPTLGGHLTEALSWRWLFFINVPPGLLVLFLVGRWGNFDKGDPSLAKGVDWPGLAAMSVSLLSMQYVLEEGAKNSWFAEDSILWLTVLSVVSGAFFVWRQLTYRQPIINLRIFGDRNFALGMFVALVSGMSLFGGTFILPLYLGQIRHYSAAQVGTTMLVSGVTMFFSGPVCRVVLRRFPTRLTIFTGFMITAYAVGRGMHVTDDWGFSQFLVMQVLRGFGIMVAMISAQQLTVSTLRPDQIKDGSAILNLTRNVGGALGLALISTVLIIRTRVHFSEISAAMGQAGGQGQAMLSGLTELMTQQNLADPSGAARKAVYELINRDAAVLAFGDTYFWLSMAAATAGVVALFAKSPKRASPAPIPAPAALSGAH